MAQAPITTIPPFGNTKELPACASSCGPLYNANGACVPPAAATAAASVYTSCFCSYGQLVPFSSVSTSVCEPNVCSETSDLASIATWFRSICNVADAATTTSSTATTGTSTSGNTNNAASSSGHPSSWISDHWHWIVMLAVLVFAIAGIWVGACIWRRHHLRKKDRQTSLGQKHSGSASRPSWGPAVTGSNSHAPGGVMYSTDSSSGRYGAPGSGVVEEKPPREQKRWKVTERT